MKWLRIGEIAKELGVCNQTIRNAERKGKVRPATRTLGNRRVYTQEEVERLRAKLFRRN